MSSEDQFTSIQWDRDDGENTNNTQLIQLLNQSLLNLKNLKIII